MHSKRLALALTVVLPVILAFLPTISRAQGATETVLHSFNGIDGTGPILGLTLARGNLYGVATEGGIYNCGTVFELAPVSGGTWNETTLYTFACGRDGSTPLGSVALDKDGNVYGTTKLGGAKGVGTVFKLAPSGSGWSKTILHNFGDTGDGQYPTGSLIFDSVGDLYGTTQGGGTYGSGSEYDGGTAYELAPQSSGAWRETILHSFGNGSDGASPRNAGLILDKAGNLYGTTSLGGLPFSFRSTTQGTVFELSRQTAGTWNETVLYEFNEANGEDGYQPVAGLIFDAQGNLYGTTASGANQGVFELSPQSGGGWTETILFSFLFCNCGNVPYSGLVFDSAGNLYGTTILNTFPYGQNDSSGEVFELSQSGGFWNLQETYGFGGTTGQNPGVGNLIFDGGKLYGAAQNGGAYNNGVVFEITP
jgi:uncharacterized repeat protein (TIGR03803 family)